MPPGCKQKKFGAVIVAAGLSSRMKTFKPMLPLGSSTVIRTAIAGFRAAGVSTIAVVVGHNADLLREHLAGLDVVCLYNSEYATTDMFRSACIGFAHLKDKTEHIYFTPGDVPLFSAGTLASLLAIIDECESPIVIPAYNGRNGHPVLISNRVLSAILAYTGNAGLVGAFSALGSAARILELDDRGVILDADTPEDYRQLQQYADERAVNQ